MRIQRLSLDFFGLFTEKTFDFGEADGPTDFHVIYGANETGKTTTMEGFLRLLYGFPNREPYDYQHQRKNLKVSGTLVLNGKPTSFVRLPMRISNLLDKAKTVLPEQAISAHLGGLSQDDYRNLFCLDDKTIERGGDDIANARGDIGRLLFSAAAGIADLNVVLEQAREDADSLYRKRASKTRLAELKRELAEIERQVREMDVSANAWHRLKKALQTAEGSEATERAARDTLRVEQALIAAFKRALPSLREHDRLVEESAEYAEYPERLDVNPEELVELKTMHGNAAAEIVRLKKEIKGAKKERDSITLNDERLALAERLDALDELRSRMQTAVVDLPRRRRTLEDAKADIKHVARELGAPEGIELTGLVKSPAEIAKLENAREAMREAASKNAAEAREVAGLEARVLQAKKAHDAFKEKASPQIGLLDLLSKFDVDTLAPAVATAREAIATSEERLKEELEELSVSGRKFTTVPDCLIDQTEAEELATQHANLVKKIERVEERLARYEEDVAVQEAQIANLTATVGVARDDEAQQARDERDALWHVHRAKLTIESADAFEPSMKRVDEIDSSQLAHARELGELRQLEQARVEAETRCTMTSKNLDELENRVKQIKTQVEHIAESIDLPKLSPAGLQSWVERHARVAVTQRKKDRLTEQYRPILDQADRLHRALRPLVSLEDPNFVAALAAARRLADAERRYQEDLKSAKEVQTSLEEQLKSRQSGLDALSKTANRASSNWNKQVMELFGDLIEPDALSNSLSQLHNIREHDVKRRQAARQVSSMEDDQRSFSEAVETLRAQHGLEGDDPLKVFHLLRKLAEQAEADNARHDKLCVKVEENINQRKKAKNRRRVIKRRVREVGALFPKTVNTSTLDALRVAVSKAQEVIQTRARIAGLEQQILAELSVPDMNEARALLDGETAPTLEARSKSVETDLNCAEDRLSQATVARANAARDLGAVTGGAEIAELVERRTTLQMQIEETALEYLEKDFGLRLAEEAIRRYRDKHRSRMMKATELAFSELTNGAYQRLRTQPDGSSEILLAIDANGTSKRVGDMSKGTRFQLYLALRAAAHEQLVSQGVQLPFFCDDVFETFDDDRTRAACKLMERIGRNGQAIYLTHHHHVVEIAKEVCNVQPVIHGL